MQHTPGGRRVPSRARTRLPRFACLFAEDSDTADLLYGCQVVSATGERIGTVDHLLVDVLTHRLRYVVLARKRNAAVVSIPWHSLYFDAVQGRLVFYTFIR